MAASRTCTCNCNCNCNCNSICICICIFLALGVCQGAAAADLFRVTAVIGTSTGTASFTTVQQTFDGLREDRLQALVPTYTGVEAAAMTIDYRGLAMSAAFPIVGNPRLDLVIPGAGISQSFVGASREQSRQMLRDYFKNGDTLGRVMKLLAQETPTDPIAGNPASLQSRMVRSSYEQHFRALASAQGGRSLGREQAAAHERPVLLASADGEPPTLGRPADAPADRSRLSVDLKLARFSGSDRSSTMVTLPYSLALGSGAEQPLSIDGDLQYTEFERTRTYGGSIGLAYRVRIDERWYLVPSASVGGTGSSDLGSVGTVVSAALTSAFRLLERPEYSLWMGNALNLLQTVKTSLGSYSFDPQLRNLAVTNGLVLSMTPSAIWQNRWLEYSFVDTRYSGSSLYDQRYDELGVAIVQAGRADDWPTTMRAELNAFGSEHSRGWGLKFGLTF